MFFDLTKEVKLNNKNYAAYKRLQIALYLFAILLGAYFAYLILFPAAYFTFSFPNPNSLQNTIIDPRLEDGGPVERGEISQTLFFDTALVGNYSKAKIRLHLNKKSDPLMLGKISLKKSYQAFFYPAGGNLDFAETNFQALKINGDYYLLKDNKLARFVSEKAYLTRYSADQATEKGTEILRDYELSDEIIGFADGTLISYGISVYIVSEGKILPVNNVVTFSAMGYDWNDVVPASGDEISLYEKDKLFTLSSPHPAGTILKTQREGKYYLLKDGKKYELSPGNADQNLLGKSPILVSKKSLDLSKGCELKKEALSFRTYSCEISLEDYKDLLGKDYEFKLTANSNIKTDNLDVIFEKTISSDNLKSAAKDIISKIRGNYAEIPVQ